MEPPVNPPIPVCGLFTRIWRGEVVTLNTDGTVDVKNVLSRAIKTAPVPHGYAPAAGHIVLVCDVDGDPQKPHVLMRFV